MELRKIAVGFFSLGIFLSSFAREPLPSCSEVWEKSSEAYNYQRDVSETPLGNQGYEKFAARLQRSKCRKPWAIFVYMQADNDLTPFALMDLYEMEAGFSSGSRANKVGSSLRSDLLVQVDTKLSNITRRIHVFQTDRPFDTKLGVEDFKKFSERDVRSPIISIFNEDENKLSPAQNLEDFLSWGVQNYPADHYMVIVWGHGQGWTSRPAQGSEKVISKFLMPEDVSIVNIEGSDGATSSGGAAVRESPTAAVDDHESPTAAVRESPTVAVDDRKDSSSPVFGGIASSVSRGTYLSIPELAQVLKNVSDQKLDGEPIDVYASDACLMQMVEVAFEISHFARFIVGSTDVQTYVGLPYRKLLQEINSGNFARENNRLRNDATADSSDEAFLLAQMIPKIFKQSMQPRGSQGRLLGKNAAASITMSAINSQELRNLLIPDLANLSSALVDYLNENPLRAIELQFVIQNTPSFLGGAEDLGAFLTLLSSLLNAEAKRDAFQSEAARALSIQVAFTRESLFRTVSSFALGSAYSKDEEKLYLLGIRAVSVWLPSSQREYQLRIADFKNSSLARVPGTWGAQWLDFVDKIYNLNQ
jgi:hypothetical protein